jgi:hypothetical protein
MKSFLQFIISTCFLLLFLNGNINTYAQEVDKRLPSMVEEIANLTRVPLGEGTLVFEHWLVYSVETKGRKRTANIYYSDTHNAFCWSDDLSHTKSFFFRDSTNATTLTLIPKNKQGTELSPAMMKAIGFTNEKQDDVIYKVDKKAATSTIKDLTCRAATASFEDVAYTMWVADRKKIKRDEREMLGRGLRFWLSNQPRLTALSSAKLKESWIPLGFNSDGYEFRVLDWGTEGTFSVVKDDFMINVPGLDLNAVAKKYVEDLKKEKEKKEEEKESLPQNED